MSKTSEVKSSEQIKSLKHELQERAEHIVFTLMPKKCLELNDLFNVSKRRDKVVAKTYDNITIEN